MKVLFSFLFVLVSNLWGEEPEVRCYRVGEKIFGVAYREAVEDWELGQASFEDGWLGPVMVKVGVESRFIEKGESWRDVTKRVGEMLGKKEFVGKALFEVKGRKLVVKAVEEVHQRIAFEIERVTPLSVRTEVGIYEVPGVSPEGCSGYWERVPDGGKLLAEVSCVSALGQGFQVKTKDELIDLEGEVQIDSKGDFSEVKLTLKVDLPEGRFEWATGFSNLNGVKWAQEVGSLDGETTLMLVVRQDLLTLGGLLKDDWILKENGGAFLREERLERVRWMEREEEVELDFTLPYQVFEVPEAFETMLSQNGEGAVFFRDGKYPELSGLKGEYYDAGKLLRENGVQVGEGEFVVVRKGRPRLYAKLSKVNLELLLLIVESMSYLDAPRMIRVDFAKVEGRDFKKGKVLKKAGIMLWPGGAGEASLGGDLAFQTEAQIDSNDNVVEMRATLTEAGGDLEKASFMTGLTLRDGKSVVIQESVEGGKMMSWVVTAKVVVLNEEVDEIFKKRE